MAAAPDSWPPRSPIGAASPASIPRRRAGGQRVDWVEADARDVRLGRRFDLVLLTGHAFQVFLTPEDREAVLATIAAHLAPDDASFSTREIQSRRSGSSGRRKNPNGT
ncbi:class I SAM-dependent methyltransferase [Mesorhizobium sp.]|uniref:class I SAM-dependent methyltransferase n=1 Tax=Mesorhizobium sp. TaxID=1871066 RepID=UPI00344EA99F